MPATAEKTRHPGQARQRSSAAHPMPGLRVAELQGARDPSRAQGGGCASANIGGVASILFGSKTISSITFAAVGAASLAGFSREPPSGHPPPRRQGGRGPSQNAKPREPGRRSPAPKIRGPAHGRNGAKTRKPNGESAPPMFPAMFIIPDTVPEYLPPTSMGTAQDGPMVHSRKNMAAVKQYTAVEASAVNAAGTMNTTQPNMPVMAPAPPGNLVLPVFFKSQTGSRPPTASPTPP